MPRLDWSALSTVVASRERMAVLRALRVPTTPSRVAHHLKMPSPHVSHAPQREEEKHMTQSYHERAMAKSWTRKSIPVAWTIDPEEIDLHLLRLSVEVLKKGPIGLSVDLWKAPTGA